MKILEKKTMSSAIALFLISSIAIAIFALPTSSAAGTNKTYPFIDAIPNPVGVNQATLLNIGLLNFLYDEKDGWNVTVTITSPDNQTETLGPYKTFSTGTYGKTFVPDQVGTYYLQTVFPGTWYNVTYFDFATFSMVRSETFYEASKSEVLELVVTQDAVPTYPGQPLPSEYWSRPINSQNREWSSLAGSWVAVPPNLYAPYNDGPESAHILWTRPIGDTMGGLAGGDTAEHSYADGDAYEGKWATSLIIGGVLYYNKYPTYFFGPSPQQSVVAVDLHTGKQLWERTFLGNGRVTFGQVLYWNSINNRGAFSYLWVTSGTNWYGFEALTGDLKYNMTNVPAGTNYYGPNGEILQYAMTNIGNASTPSWRLTQWNSSWVVTNGKLGMSESWGSQVQGVSYNAATLGYDMNVSIPAGLPGGIQKVFVGDKVIGARATLTEVNLWALSLKPTNKGALLYNKTWTPPAEWVQGNLTIGGIGQAGWTAWSQEDQVGVFFTKENRVHYGFDLETGNFLWETEPQIFIDAWSDTVTSFGPDRVIAYGKLYSATVGGIVYAYNVTTGERLWTYEADDLYLESYIGNNWWTVPLFVTDGKIYIGHMEHSALNPKPRGAPFFALDATTGDLVWRIDGAFRQSRWGGRAIIGDSIIATQDTYDQRVYAIGKGPSATTVSAPDVAAPVNTSVVIKGTVTDVSPGTQSDELKLRFPSGVAAVSDDSMSDWMLYVYQQSARPTNTTGVQVKLTAIDSNMNPIDIGTATSDVYGNYGFSWQPQSSGTYQIIATFDGSKSYYGSAATTYVNVAEVHETSIQEPAVAPDNMLVIYAVIAAAIAIIVAVAIVGALMLRKR
jgi:outer membrane protein assembly factor BamB